MQADFEICESDIAGTTITITASGGGGGGNYDFQIDPPGPGPKDNYNNESSPFSFDASGDLSVGVNTFLLERVEASGGNGCILTGSPIDATVVTVDANVTTPTTGADENVCATFYADLDGNTPGSGTGLWTVQGGSGASIDDNLDPNTGVTNLDVGVNTFRWTITNGECEEFEEITITRNALPVPALAGPNDVCEASIGNVYTTDAGMTNYVWVVDMDGTKTAGGAGTDNTVTVTWDNPGAQTVTVNYDDDNGCTASSPTIYNVTVNPNPTTSITPALPGEQCAGCIINNIQDTI
ncbi:hypothetical protein ES708_31734 [subsurface metagenome]